MLKADVIEKLKALVHLDYDAIKAYRRAIDRIKEPAIKEQLTLFLADHGRHVHDLKAAIENLGGDPAKDPGRDAKGVLIELVTFVRSLFGTKSALRAMRRNEQLTNSMYERALAADLPAEVLAIIRRNREDEARHLEYIEATLVQLEGVAVAGARR